MSRVESVRPVKTEYLAKAQQSTGNGDGNESDFAFMLTKCQSKTATDTGKKQVKQETGSARKNDTKEKTEKTEKADSTDKASDAKTEKEEGTAAGETLAGYVAEAGYQMFIQTANLNADAEPMVTLQTDAAVEKVAQTGLTEMASTLTEMPDVAGEAAAATLGAEMIEIPKTSQSAQEVIQNTLTSGLQETGTPEEVPVQAMGESVQKAEIPKNSTLPEPTENAAQTAEAAKPLTETEIQGVAKKEDANAEADAEENSGTASEYSNSTQQSQTALHAAMNHDNVQTVRETETLARPEQTGTLKTTQETLPEDLGKQLYTSMTQKKGQLELYLEPASLGKLTIRMEYEEGKTAVTIFSSNAKTLDILTREAGRLAQILEEKTGTPTEIYTPEQADNSDPMEEPADHQQEERQQHRERPKQQDDSFAQQLRLGLA